jgi:hypothetical protein
VRQNRYIAIAVLGLFSLAVAGGLLIAGRLGPRQVEREIEQRLSQSLGTQVSVEQLAVSPGTFVRVEAEGVSAWPSGAEQRAGLEIERITGSIDAVALAAGEIRLRRIRIDSARLRLHRKAGGRWSPAIDVRDPEQANAPPHPDELLAPLISLEATVRSLLAAPSLATTLEFANAQIDFQSDVERDSDSDASQPTELSLTGVHGRLVHGRFRRRSEVNLQARLTESGHDRGGIELVGVRDPEGAITISIELSDVEIGSLGHRTGARVARLAGRVDGRIDYQTSQPGTGRLSVDLGLQDFASTVPLATGVLESLRSDRVDVTGILEMTPDSVTLSAMHVSNRETSLEVGGTLARPLQPASRAALSVSFRNVDVRAVRQLIGWLPEIEREEAEAFVAPIENGRIASLRAGGAASLSHWQAFLAGRTRQLPSNFLVDVELADTTLHVGESDRLEGLRGRLHWADEQVEVSEAAAVLNGSPLPTLQLSIEGFPNFFAGDPALRELRSGAEALAGLSTLWKTLRPDSVPGGEHSIAVELDVEALDHPMFLWPIRDAEARIETRSGGVHIEVNRGTWAGVSIRGEGSWQFLPDESVSIRIVAGPAEKSELAALPPGIWARGRFAVGSVERGRWRQASASGAFQSSSDGVRVDEVELALLPSGRVDGTGTLDLSRSEHVPFRLSFDLAGGDAPALARLVGLPPRQIDGAVDGWGSFEGALRPGESVFDSMTGLLDLRVTDGRIFMVSPPVVAVAAASEELEDFDPKDVIEFDRAETVLEFDHGLMSSESFAIDGPKLGVFATGRVDLAGNEHEVDAEVALFLFRKLDRVLGKIPLLNRLLLGSDENLVAAAYEITGPWKAPQVAAISLPRSAGPTSKVLHGVPHLLKRGLSAVAGLIRPRSLATNEPSVEGPDKPASGS